MKTPLHLAGLVTVLLAGAGAWAGELAVRYQYGLSDLGGPIRTMGGRLRVDRLNNETLYVENNTVHVFNASGMETYSFVIDSELGSIFDAAVDPSGDFLLGCTNPGPGAGAPTFVIRRCDYRGRLKSTIQPGLPAELERFSPSAMQLRDGKLLYFVSPMQLEAVVLRLDGGFVRHVDLAPLLEVDEEERGNLEIGGFGFDAEGNLLFTIPEHFRAIVVTPDWTVRAAFGRKGSGPGRFGVVGGIAGDDQGNVYVADKGRNVVLAFDKGYKFVTEFGGYGDQPENLVRPDQVAWLPTGKLLVSQMKHRGVSVFEVASK